MGRGFSASGPIGMGCEGSSSKSKAIKESILNYKNYCFDRRE